jgi:hypothetical protein
MQVADATAFYRPSTSSRANGAAAVLLCLMGSLQLAKARRRRAEAVRPRPRARVVSTEKSVVRLYILDKLVSTRYLFLRKVCERVSPNAPNLPGMVGDPA